MEDVYLVTIFSLLTLVSGHECKRMMNVKGTEDKYQKISPKLEWTILDINPTSVVPLISMKWLISYLSSLSLSFPFNKAKYYCGYLKNLSDVSQRAYNIRYTQIIANAVIIRIIMVYLNFRHSSAFSPHLVYFNCRVVLDLV